MALPISKKLLNNSPDEAAQGKVKGGDGGNQQGEHGIGIHLAPGEEHPREAGPEGSEAEDALYGQSRGRGGNGNPQLNHGLHKASGMHSDIKPVKPGAGLHNPMIMGG